MWRAFIISIIFTFTASQNDSSLPTSEEVNKVHNFVPEEIKSLHEHGGWDKLKKRLKVEKENEKRIRNLHHLEKKEGYQLFVCAMENINVDTEEIFPRFYVDTTIHVELPFHLEHITMKNFASVEQTCKDLRFYYGIPHKHKAKKKIPQFYKSMYIILTKCDDKNYTNDHNINMNEVFKANFIKKKLNQKFEHPTDQDQMIKDFSSFLARIRHGCNGYRNHFGTVVSRMDYKNRKILEKETCPTFVELLHEIGFLAAWNFTQSDIEYLNLIKDILRELRFELYPLPPYYSYTSFSYKVKIFKMDISGCLPAFEGCPEQQT